MAVAKVFRNGGSYVFVVRRNVRKKYTIKPGDRVDYMLNKIINKNQNVNELMEGILVRNVSGSYVLRIPYEVIVAYNIEEGDFISFEIVR